MSASPLSSDEIRAAAEVHRELGPEYSDAVVESFFEKIDQEIGARVDAHLTSAPRRRKRQVDPVGAGQRRPAVTGIAIGSAVTGVPLTLLVLLMRGSAAVDADWYQWLIGSWLVIVVSCVIGASGIRLRRTPGSR
jgi:hypothetical protein